MDLAIFFVSLIQTLNHILLLISCLVTCHRCYAVRLCFLYQKLITLLILYFDKLSTVAPFLGSIIVEGTTVFALSYVMLHLAK